jgi:hypothetical protein
MLRERNFRVWAVVAILVLHIGWIANHMRLVANDRINPWRLGGYAMYTVPNPGSKIVAYDPDFPDTPLVARFMHYEAAARSTNASRTFRCADVSAASLRAFFDENQDLIGRNIVLVYLEKRLVRSPLSTNLETQGTVSVVWQDERSFTYTSKFCGNEHTASATLPETAFATSPSLP